MRHFGRIFFAVMTAALLLTAAFAQQDTINTVVGGGPNDMPAVDANLNLPVAVYVDAAGNYYLANYQQQRVFRVNPAGTLTVVAGNGINGFAGDGVVGGAGSAYLNYPQGVVADVSGNVYIADTYNCVVRKVDTTNTITTVAGMGQQCGYTGEGTATQKQLSYPIGLAIDGSGNLYIADSSNCRIRKLSGSTISTVAGNGTCGYAGDGGTATSANLSSPSGVAVDSSGNIFIADTTNYVIRKVTASTGKISRIAGTANVAGFSGDGASALSATINAVYQLAVNSAGTSVWIADYGNWRIRKFVVGSTINTVVGSGNGGFCGDGGFASAACLYYPQGVSVDAAGDIFIADSYNERIREVNTSAIINTVAGNGSTTLPTPVNGTPALGVVLNTPFGVIGDPSSNIFIGDTSNQLVSEMVQSSGDVDFVAGTGVYGYNGDNQTGTNAELAFPNAVARDSAGNLYIADTSNCLVREVNTAGIITTVAGNTSGGSPHCGYSGDGGPATSAMLASPTGVYVDSANNLWIADTYNQVIREVVNGTINTVAGNGLAGYSGDGGPATSAKLQDPYGVTTDAAGNIFIADTYNHRIREVSALSQTINTVAGNGAATFTGDGPATQVSLSYPSWVTVDANGNMFIADTFNNRLRWVDTGGLMTTFAGGGGASSFGFMGDGGIATSALLADPYQLYEDASGNFLFADGYNYRIRSVSAFAALNRSVSSLTFGIQAVTTTSSPQYVKLSAVGPLNISSITVSGPFSESDNCGGAMVNGAICTLYVFFTPTKAGAVSGTITINDNGFFSSSQTIALTGTGTAMSVTPNTEAFGNQIVKTTSPAKIVTVKNNGSTALTMGVISLINTTDFAISANTCPASGLTLAGKASCTVSLTFTPQSTGAKKGTLVVNDSDPLSPQLVGLTGTGTSNVTFTPASVSFATTAIGSTSAASSVTLTNKSGVNLTLSTPALSTTGPFAVTATGTTCTNGLVLANNATCVIKVTFTPTAMGTASGSLNVSDSDATSPQSVPLTGTGTEVKFTPSSLSFGTVTRGTAVSGSVTLKNVGSSTLMIAFATMSGANSADFTNQNSNPPCNGSVAPGASCTLNFLFNPTLVGKETATYAISDNGGGSPQKLTLTGTGQ